MLELPPISTLFPYTTLFRSVQRRVGAPIDHARATLGDLDPVRVPPDAGELGEVALAQPLSLDRKSTRLNSSHLGISYAVFCLKKKKDCTQTHPCKWSVDISV